MNEVLLKANKLKKSYTQGISELEILKGIDLEIRHKESLCIVGSSGSGKSTLLHILGTLDRPSSGELFVAGQDVLSMSDDDLAKYRNSKMGFVFQFHHLLNEFSALENVMIPLRLSGVEKPEAKERAIDLLGVMGLAQRVDHYPTQLSGGELQRVAIARALVNNPQILFADEPTGNLDSKNSFHVQDIFFELKEKMGLTLIIVTHDINFARRFGRVLKISDGQWSPY